MREEKIIDVATWLSHTLVIVGDAIYFVDVTVPSWNLHDFGGIVEHVGWPIELTWASIAPSCLSCVNKSAVPERRPRSGCRLGEIWFGGTRLRGSRRHRAWSKQICGVDTTLQRRQRPMEWDSAPTRCPLGDHWTVDRTWWSKIGLSEWIYINYMSRLCRAVLWRPAAAEGGCNQNSAYRHFFSRNLRKPTLTK